MNCGLPCKLKGRHGADGKVEPCSIIKALNAGSKARLDSFIKAAGLAGKKVEEVEVMFGPPTKFDVVDFYKVPKAAQCIEHKQDVVITPGFEPSEQIIPCWGRCFVTVPEEHAEVISATYELGDFGSFWNIKVAVAYL